MSKKIYHKSIINNFNLNQLSTGQQKTVVLLIILAQSEYLINELNFNKGGTSLKFRQKMSENAFLETAYYDSVIANYFNILSGNKFPNKKIMRNADVSNQDISEEEKISIKSEIDNIKNKDLEKSIVNLGASIKREDR